MSFWWKEFLMKWLLNITQSVGEMDSWWKGMLMKILVDEMTSRWNGRLMKLLCNDYVIKWFINEYTSWWNEQLMKWLSIQPSKPIQSNLIQSNPIQSIQSNPITVHLYLWPSVCLYFLSFYLSFHLPNFLFACICATLSACFTFVLHENYHQR